MLFMIILESFHDQERTWIRYLFGIRGFILPCILGWLPRRSSGRRPVSRENLIESPLLRLIETLLTESITSQVLHSLTSQVPFAQSVIRMARSAATYLLEIMTGLSSWSCSRDGMVFWKLLFIWRAWRTGVAVRCLIPLTGEPTETLMDAERTVYHDWLDFVAFQYKKFVIHRSTGRVELAAPSENLPKKEVIGL
ncbi:hypothetical protein VTN77DRAFT_6421 [Rasamsonia byssochlamydoides]|uniref:uncharacterized protein n=1 Tax=Rasamsonia byssochlamydoides TaxID=89139 RepID=UPI003743BA63